jgi:hypothetical protein
MLDLILDHEVVFEMNIHEVGAQMTFRFRLQFMDFTES